MEVWIGVGFVFEEFPGKRLGLEVMGISIEISLPRKSFFMDASILQLPEWHSRVYCLLFVDNKIVL